MCYGKDASPITAAPQVIKNGNYMTLKWATGGGSIGYKISNGKAANKEAAG